MAFESNAANLSGEDNDAFRDVFLRDTQTGAVTLVSRRSAAEGGTGGNDVSEVNGISADGRYVAFSSDADNLSASDDNAHLNVFVRDTATATTILVSRQSAGDGGDGGDGQVGLRIHVRGRPLRRLRVQREQPGRGRRQRRPSCSVMPTRTGRTSGRLRSHASVCDARRARPRPAGQA